MTIEAYKDMYRAQSAIVGDYTSRTTYTTGKSQPIRQHLVEIVGDPATPGFVMYKSPQNFKRSILGNLEARLALLDEDFRAYKRRMVREGHETPREWPVALLDQKNQLKARIAIRKEEVQQLKKDLAEALKIEEAAEPEGTKCLPRDKSLWGIAKLRHGVIETIGGQRCTLKTTDDGDQIVCIADSRSPYNGMPVWMFKAQITKPMGIELRWRQMQENRRAKAEKRAAKPLRSYPEPPAYDPKTGKVTLPKSYSDFTRNKLNGTLK